MSGHLEGCSIVAVVGSPRPAGNTSLLVDAALAELAARGAGVRKLSLGDYAIAPCQGHEGCAGFAFCPHRDDAEEVLDAVYSADGLILASPVYYENVTAQMKAFMDATNDRYMNEQWLTPRTVGLLAIGVHVFTSTIEAMQRYLDLIAPSHPPVVVATGRADAVGEAQSSQAVREAALTMAAGMADVLLG